MITIGNKSQLAVAIAVAASITRRSVNSLNNGGSMGEISLEKTPQIMDGAKKVKAQMEERNKTLETL